MIVAMYLRKSRADIELEKQGEFETLKKHEKMLREYASKNDLQIIETFKELVSGESIDSRPEMQKLLDNVSENKYEGVLVVELERLARGNGIDQSIILETFKSSETLIITPVKTYDPNDPAEEQFFELGLLISRFEYRTIKKRLERGRLQSLKDGNYIGKPLFGYDIVKQNGKRTLIPNSDSKYVQYIFDEYTSGVSVSNIASHLQALDIRTTNGNLITTSNIRRILKNERYAGISTYGKTSVKSQFNVHDKTTEKIRTYHNEPVIKLENNHPAIVSRETYEMANRLMKSNCYSTNAKKPLRNIFATLVYCEKCGSVFPLQHANSNGKDYWYIRHDSPCHSKDKCCPNLSVGIFYDDFVTFFIDTVKNDIENFEIEIESEHEDNSENMITEYQSKIEDFKKKLNKLYTFFENEIYSEDEFLARRKIYNDGIKECEQKIKELESVSQIDYKNMIVSLYTVLDSLKSELIPATSKNVLLKSIIEKIYMNYKDNKWEMKIKYKFE